MKFGRSKTSGIACLLAVAALAAGRLPRGHAAGEDAAPQGEAGAKAAAAPAFPLGAPLNGHFDIHVLRSGDRVSGFRSELKPMAEFIGANNDWQVRVTVVLEFGDGSGVAEIVQGLDQAQNDVRAALQTFEGAELLKLEGKYRFKETVIEMVNQRLRTAQVRQVYLTQFQLLHVTPS